MQLSVYFAIASNAEATAIELFYHDWRRIPQQRQNLKLLRWSGDENSCDKI